MAGQRLTDKTALEEQLGSGDLFMVVDVNDSTGSAEGTSKKFDTKYLIQTDKISVTNAELQLMKADGSAGSFKTLVGALSGYMITVYNVTVLCTYGASTEGSNNNLYFGYKSDSITAYWSYARRFMSGETDDITASFAGVAPSGGTCKESILNKPFLMYANSPFDGGWTCDVYVTYAYTKVL
tara:strand:- start:71 stop:616 length:546 start_codon:yes stop_codon:yes gene_type:complete